MAVGTEVDRILRSNNILMISENLHHNNQAGNEQELPELPELYRIRANLVSDHLVRTGAV